MKIVIASVYFFLLLCSKSFAGPNELLDDGKEFMVDKGKGKAVRYSKNGVRSVIDKLPGGKFFSDMIFDDGDSMEDKVDRIDKNQKTSLGRIRDISRKVLDSKRKVEDMWYYKTWSIEQGTSLAAKLRHSKNKKLFLASLEGALEMPVNPAAYIPNIPPTQKLKQNLNYDLSLERSSMQHTGYMLSNTRGSLMKSGLWKTNPKEFQRKYKEAEDYEGHLRAAMKAKEITTTRIYKADVEQLEAQIKVLEEHQTKKGLTVSEVMQIEIAIDNKRKHIRSLNAKIDKSIINSTELSEQDKIDAIVAKADEDCRNLAAYIRQERIRRHNK